ncbi:hypothetical protein BGY98DRAFT_962232 [Russula aff. rugulosa BPL654]|nr:hypothetical protein BGY98DRAFT_962232 [Russula aff. rugulosa BPL654]
MGKLNIAHHKSYHPYRLDNIERVRRDEASAKRKQTEDTDRALVADAESRLSTLRARAGITPPSPPPHIADTGSNITPVASGSDIPLSNGHINLFADLEEHAAALAARASKSKPAMTDLDRGIPLAPTIQDLHPWYSAAGTGNNDDKPTEARRQRDLARQRKADPLSSIPSHLKRPLHSHAAKPPPQSHSYSQSEQSQKPLPSSASLEGRLARESVERGRALALLRRKQREREQAARTTATPSTVNGGDGGPGYADVFNRREVEDAHRERDRSWRHRRWEDDGRDSHRRRH